ncbi:U-box domain-containing protein 44 [Platanthera zijinensis]|uniref:RING-type E3 ubiquitin transferase n=1 Tax=Platanthera zijinensis TaxID=2320716 RepID=A0AAP0ATR4_9ASPA
MDVLTNLRDDSLKRMVDAVSELIAAAERIKHEEENIRRFSIQMISVKELLINLEQSQQQQQQQQPGGGGGGGGKFALGSAVSLLRRMEDAVNTARETIDWYNSKGSFVRFVFCSSVFSKLTQCSKQIADALRLLPITQISPALHDKAKLDAIIHSLDSIVFSIEANAEAIHSRLDMYVAAEKNGRIRQPMIQKLADINNPRPAAACGIGSPIMESPEEEEVQFGDLNQTLNILCSVDEIVNLSIFCLSCPLTLKIMEDPACVSCNHSYERKAIEEYFRGGEKLCLVCKKEMSSTEGKLDLKPNSALRSIILEWKQNRTSIQALENAKKKLSDASARLIISINNNVEPSMNINAALEDLLSPMMDIPDCISEATNGSCKLIPNLAALLKKKTAGVNITAVLQCLLLIARFSDGNKEIIGRRGVIQCLLNQCRMNEAAAVEILLELSKDDRVAQKIIETNTSIATLVSILHNPEPQFAENARAVLKNLSTDVKSTIMMAVCGYLDPFLDLFNSEGISEETRAFMAGELAQMHLTETAASSLENELFIIHLSVMLSNSLPASKLASLGCIKRLISSNRSRTWILSNGHTIPSGLLCFLRDTSIEQRWKQDALEILISLIDLSQPSEQQTNPSLERLYSHNSIQDLIEQIKSSTDQDDRVLLLQLLLAMVQKSSTAQDCLISNQNAVSSLYFVLRTADDNSKVRLHALKLIYHIAASTPDLDAPLPPHPAKERALRSIIAILTESHIDEEISMVAGIISHLPRSDKAINAMLQSSAVLRAIHLQISRLNNSNELLENALGALLRCIDQSTTEFQMQLVGNLEQAIVQILTTSSPLSRQRAAMILAHLNRRTPGLSTSPDSSFHFRRHSWPFQSSTKCALHESSCSLQRVMCLVKIRAVRPLVCMIDSMNPAASEAALTALLTLFEPGATETLLNAASSIIVDSQVAAPILKVLEKRPLPRVEKAAFELFQKIYKHPGITWEQLEKFKAILPYLLNGDNEQKKNVTMLIKELF